MRNRLILLTALVSLALVLASCEAHDEAGRPAQPNLLSPTTAVQSGATTTAVEDSIVCRSTSALVAGIPTLDGLVWTSHRIVVGTVVERLPTVPHPENPKWPFYTDYAVRVEEVWRGAPIEVVHIRRGGGSISEGCSEEENGPPLNVGDRLLFFLSFPDPGASVTTYTPTGTWQGYWRVTPEGNVMPEIGRFRDDGGPLDDVAARVAKILSEQPPKHVSGLPTVPLEKAEPGPDLPVVPEPTRAP